MSAAYYDSNYLFKLQAQEVGSAEVRNHAATVKTLYSAIHSRAECTSAAFRNMREGFATHSQFLAFVAQTHADIDSGNLRLLHLTDTILDHIEAVFASAPPTTYLRAADAIHLATAAAHGFTEIYSNDKHLLTAAPLFGLKGVNVIP